MSRKPKKTVAKKMIINLFIVMILIFTCIAIFFFNHAKQSLLKEIKEETQMTGKNISLQINSYFEKNKLVTNQMTTNEQITTYLKEVNTYEDVIQHRYYEDVSKTLDVIRDANPFLKYTWIANDRANFYISNKGTVSKEDFKCETRKWYRLALDNKGVQFSEPYVTLKEGTLVITAITAVRENNKVLGFISSDMALDFIKEFMNKGIIGDKGKSFLIDSRGVYYYHEDQEKLGKENILKEDNDLKNIGEKMINGEEGITEITIDGKAKYITYYPVEANNWAVGLIIDKDEVLQGLNQFKIVTIIIFIVGLIIILAIFFFYIKSTLRPISVATEYANELSKCNFQSDVSMSLLDREDEIGNLVRALDGVAKNIRVLVKEIIDSSNNVSESSQELAIASRESTITSEQIARTIEDIAVGATEQAKGTETGAEMTTELGALIEGNQQDLEYLNKSVNKVEKITDEGKKVLNNLVENTKESNSYSKLVYESIVETNRSTEKINEASKVIASIAEQTNLLALNASIEAARAGELGRGFAVVADEIRKLAEQSTLSTKEIESVIKDLHVNSNKSVKAMEDANQIVSKQFENVELTEEKYNEIIKSVRDSKEIINKLNKSGREMEEKKESIVNMIKNLAEIAENNAASTEEAAASTEEQSASIMEMNNGSGSLAELAEKLLKDVKKFKI
ncbi:methyl-accepting chemotaxis protein [Wukongibacter baidiensis]|uniref:methyl-accepting chemotaxis protein n=1 Tax=Wukongibacter baidiensis TaxID=1723361 RepID=UPI003D7F9D87